jgi:hypothetical protein
MTVICRYTQSPQVPGYGADEVALAAALGAVTSEEGCGVQLLPDEVDGPQRSNGSRDRAPFKIQI